MDDLPPTRGGELFFPAAEGPFFPWVGSAPADLASADPAMVDLISAELSRLAYAPLPRIEEELGRIGLSILARLESRRLFPAAGVDGFVCRDPRSGTLFAVFRGTESGNVDDLLANLAFDPVEWRPGRIVHRGYALTFDELRGPLGEWLDAPRGRAIATGHSLGGALATLCAADFPAVELVTFGAPRVGTDSLALGPRQPVRRYVHCCDIVPRVPPASFAEDDLHDLAAGLLDNLGPADGWLAAASQTALRQSARLAAGAVAKFALARGWNHAFAHPGPQVYLDRRGRTHVEPDAASVAADQRQARQDYRDALGTGARGGDSGAVLEALGGLSLALVRGDLEAARAARMRLIGELSRSDALGRVVVRDLADHAAIHYVRALLPAGAPLTRTLPPPRPGPDRT